MTTLDIVLVVATLLTLLGLGPTAFIVVRERARRRQEARLEADTEAVAKRLLDATEDTETAKVSLGKRYPIPVLSAGIDRALKRAKDVDARARVIELANALDVVATLVRDVREAASWSDRDHAARLLGDIGAPAAIPALASALRDPHEDEASVKKTAAEALARVGGPDAIDLLIAELVRSDDQATQLVADALVDSGPAATEPLLAVLADSKRGTGRVWAARILGQIGDPRAVDALVARLHDRHEPLRSAVAEALGRIADARATRALSQAALRDPVPQVRAHAAAALAPVAGAHALDILIAALADADHGTRLRALEAFEHVELRDRTPLLTAMRDPNADVRRRAALALDRVGYVADLVEQLQSPRAKVSNAAYAKLLEVGRAGVVDSIASYTTHDAFTVRSLAARALGELGEPRTAPHVLALLKDDDWPVRAAAAEALTTLRPDDAVPALIETLADDEEPVREAAAEALAQYPPTALAGHLATLESTYDTGTVPVRLDMITIAARLEGESIDRLLVKGSEDPSDAVRLRAVEALGRRTGEAVIAALVPRLTDAALDVRMAAISAMGSTASPEAFDGLLRSLSGAPVHIRERVADAIARGGRDHLFERIELLADTDDADIRLGLVWALGKTADPRAVGPLASLLEDPSEKIRASAAGALGKIGAPQAARALAAAHGDRDPRVRAAVVNALGRIGEGDPDVLEALRSRLSGPDAFVRNRAMIALARAAPAAAREQLADPALERTIDRDHFLIAQVIADTDNARARAAEVLATRDGLSRIKARLEKEDRAVRDAFFGALGIPDPESIIADADDLRALVDRYDRVLRTSRDIRARQTAIEVIARANEPNTVEILGAALGGDPAESVRLAAAERLAERPASKQRAEALLRAMDDPSIDVALAAISALANEPPEHVSKPLVARLGAGPDEVDAIVEETLAHMHTNDPMPLIDAMMGTDQAAPMAAAARVLAAIGDPSTAPLMLSLAQSESELVRAAAARALGAASSGETQEALDTLLQDPVESVRLEALGACTRSGSDRALMRVAGLRSDPSENVRTTLAAKLGQYPGQAALKILRQLATDASALVQCRALVSLLERRDTTSMKTFIDVWPSASLMARHELRRFPERHALIEQLGGIVTGHRDAEAREGAVLGLAALAGSDAEEALASALRDPDPNVRVSAVRSLSSSTTESVRAQIERLLKDPDPRVREAAEIAHTHRVG